MKCVFLIAQFCMFYEKSYIDRYVILMLAQIRLCGICKETSQSLTGRLPETTGELYGRALSVLYYVPSALCLHQRYQAGSGSSRTLSGLNRSVLMEMYSEYRDEEMELFDVVDAKGIPTGEIIERSEAHEKDIPHRTAHVWVVRMKNGKPQVLLQKRAAGKESFPGCYDTSSAGHIHAGDEPLESALRELEEELGIKADESDLSYAGIFHSHYEKIFYAKPFRDNEITFVYVYDRPVEIDDLTLQEDEVESVKWFDADYVQEKISPPRDELFCVPREGFSLVMEWMMNNKNI